MVIQQVMIVIYIVLKTRTIKLCLQANVMYFCIVCYLISRPGGTRSA